MINRKILAGLLCFALLAGAAGYKLMRQTEKGITATGTIEVTRADITPKVGGYLTELLLEAGDSVENGKVVARISRSDLEAQLLRDEAALTKAQVQLQDLVKGSREQEKTASTADMAAAQSVFDKAKHDLERYTVLYHQGAIAAQQLESIRSAYDVAYNSLVAAQAKSSLTEEGNRPDEIQAQQEEVKRCQAIVDASRSAVADTVITSPLTGLVLTKNFEQGEYVNAGAPIATVGDMNDCWVKVYVPSAQLALIAVGQVAEVKVDAFPGRVFAGTIKEISSNAEFNPRQSITQRERANLVFAVKVKVDNAEGILKPGLPADVIIP